MVWLRVDTRPLFSQLRAELGALLDGLADDDWERPTACPGWPVHGVAAHLFGVELGNVSIRRDGWGLSPRPGEHLDSWLNGFNQQWVEASRRISPRLLVELINVAAPLGAAFTSPVLTTAAHALPRALDGMTRPAGTVVTFTVEGEGSRRSSADAGFRSL